MRVDSILECIGNTPTVELKRMAGGQGARLWAKLEFFNPLGCVKDRVALALLEGAEQRGEIEPQRSIIVEPTSGNLGLGLALACGAKGYRFIAVVPDTMVNEKVAIIRHMGARVVLSPGHLGARGAIETARSIARRYTGRAHVLQQFENPDNALAHYRTTGAELVRDFASDGVAAFVAGIGTGGTFTGVGRALRETWGNDVELVAVEPAGSAILSGDPSGSHAIPGIGVGFVPGVLDRSLIDAVLPVSDAAALHTARRLAHEEGIFAGISAGASVFAGMQVARRLASHQNVVCLLADSGMKYLASGLLFPALQLHTWDEAQGEFVPVCDAAA